MPPSRKKNSEAAPYMMPIFLWSTVKSQLFQPVVAVGREKPPSGRRTLADPGESSRGAVGLSTIAMSVPLVQGGQVRRPRVDLGVVQVEDLRRADEVVAALARVARDRRLQLGRG